MIIRSILALLLLGLIFGGVFGWKYLQMQKMAEQFSAPRPPTVVASADVSKETWPQFLEGVGQLSASMGASISTEEGGRIVEIGFTSGAYVKKGTLLLRLDTSIEEAELNELLAERHLAELEFNRAEELLPKRALSQADYDKAQAELERAAAAVESKRAEIAKRIIHAPFSGRLGIRQVDLGEYLAPGDTIVDLQALDPIYIDVALPERYLQLLHQEQTMQVRVQPYPDEAFAATVSAIAPEVRPTTRMIQLRGTLANEDERLRPGLSAKVHIQLPDKENILTIPQTAVSFNPYGASVFLIEHKEGQQIVQTKRIEPGEVHNGKVEVISGLSEGQTVVSAGQVKLRNGMPIAVDNSVSLPEEVATP